MSYQTLLLRLHFSNVQVPVVICHNERELFNAFQNSWKIVLDKSLTDLTIMSVAKF